MRYIILSESELQDIKKLHESILSKSSHGLFHSAGKIMGKTITNEIQSRDNFFEEAAMILKERNFVSEILFEEKKVTVEGSIESHEANEPTCDIIRGILVCLYREYYNKTVYCEEIECVSMGADKCIFEIKEEII